MNTSVKCPMTQDGGGVCVGEMGLQVESGDKRRRSKFYSILLESGDMYENVMQEQSGLRCIIRKSYIQKAKKNGGDYLSAQKNWRKKCVNIDDKYMYFQNMRFVCIYLRFKQYLNMI